MRLYEKKDHLIRKNPNLTDGQKQEIIKVLTKHPSSENLIDWTRNNKLTYEDFLNVLRPLYINDLDFRGLIEGEDYDLLLDKPKEKLYAIYTHNASKIIASNSVEPKLWTELPYWCGEEEFKDEAHAFGHFDSEHKDMKPGAKWCISMQTSDNYWNRYSNKFYFVFWIRENGRIKSNQKIALCIDREEGNIATMYNAEDNEVSLKLPSHIKEAINSKLKNIREKEKQSKVQKLLSEFILNTETNRYDYEGSLSPFILKDFVSEDGDGFIINFGRVTGTFDCHGLGLKSLKGAPIEVEGWFYCFENQLTSLEGAPQEVGGGFYCNNNQLISLEGSPQEVGRDFNCKNNQLSSLEGAPKYVGGSFNCYNNQLTSLEGSPKIIGEWFECSWNKLTSLKGAPQIVGGTFSCSENQLTSLEGAPQEVGGAFNCTHNQLTSLKGAPKIVKNWFSCGNNPNLHSLEGIGEVKGKIYRDF